HPDDMAVLAHELAGGDPSQGDLVSTRDGVAGHDGLPARHGQGGPLVAATQRHRHVVVRGQQHHVAVHARVSSTAARLCDSVGRNPVPPRPCTDREAAAVPSRTASSSSSTSANRAATVPANTSPAPVWPPPRRGGAAGTATT